jgi:SNF2 family DNA or RNA helicase
MRLTGGKTFKVPFDVVSKPANGDPPRLIVICPDTLIHKWENIQLAHDGRPWSLLVIDECHRLKESTSLRARAVFGHGKKRPGIKADRVIAVTGTPILNRPREIFGVLKFLEPGQWGDKFKFLNRFCGPKTNRFGTTFDGASNLDELQFRLRSGPLIRRSKEEVLPQLPAKMRSVLEVQAGKGAVSLLKAEASALAGLPDEIREALLDMSEGVSPKDLAEMARLRERIALEKVQAVVEHVKDLLEEHEKVVVFLHHHSVGRAIFEGLDVHGDELLGAGVCYVSSDGALTLCRYDGRLDQAQKDQSVETFRDCSGKAVFIASIQAAGVGLNLQVASACVFAEMTWVPGEMTQAEDRLVRIGSKGDFVLIQHVVLDGSLDARLARRLIEKQAVIDAALDRL